ncbi:MAG: hypothetical protein WC412_00970 [Candidatus Omnitrophota bacterium]
MTEKVFKIMCSSNDCLTADTIALALLRQVSMESNSAKVFFAVKEVKKDSDGSIGQSQVCFIEE